MSHNHVLGPIGTIFCKSSKANCEIYFTNAPINYTFKLVWKLNWTGFFYSFFTEQTLKIQFNYILYNNNNNNDNNHHENILQEI